MKKKPALQLDLETIMPILIGVWRRFRKESGPPDKLQTREFRTVVAAVSQLIHGLETEKKLVGEDYFKDPHLLSAYLLYQWVIHYQQGFSLLSELPTIPKRVLDIGSGPAAFSFAALRYGANEVYALDQNTTALQLGAEICGRYGLPITVRKWQHKPTSLKIGIDGKFDLIILAHCIEELFPTSRSKWKEEQQAFIEGLLDRLSPQGYLMIVDSSLVPSNQRILELRDQLVQAGVPVQAPCIWRGACPAFQLKGSPCYAQREMVKPALIKEIQRSASINLGSLKMTYLILRNPQAGWPSLPDKQLYRVISPPIEAFQGERYYLCGSSGKKNLGSHLKIHPPESRAFEYLRRGDLISIKDALDKQQSFDIVEGTQVRLEAPCNKPLPEN